MGAEKSEESRRRYGWKYSGVRPMEERKGQTVAELIERGWSRPAIQRLLGEPDERYASPYGPRRLRWYKMERILKVEEGVGWRKKDRRESFSSIDGRTGFLWTELVRRGWSASAIRRLLGDPDQRPESPYGKHPLRWYCSERVLAAEAGTAWRRKPRARKRMVDSSLDGVFSQAVYRPARTGGSKNPDLKIDWHASITKGRLVAVKACSRGGNEYE